MVEVTEGETKITPAYCQEFHRIAWEQACQVNNTNPLAVAEGIKELVEVAKALIEHMTMPKNELGRPYLADVQRLARQALFKVRGNRNEI